jgi:two-component system LytT family sensor kinase
MFCSMNQSILFLRKLINLAGSRIALNIYFWVAILVLKISDADDQQAYPNIFYYLLMVFFLAFFAAVSYINNLYLLPVFLFRKKYLKYFIFLLLLVSGISYLYTYLLIYLPRIFPGLDTMVLSIVMDPVDNDLSPAGVAGNMMTYFFFMLVWAFFFMLLGIYYRNKKQLADMQAVLNQHREVELTMLKNQIHPHFLFNTLNNLYALALKKSDDTPELILKLSAVLRYMIYEAATPLVSFSREKEVIQAYTDIELLRVQNTQQVHFSIVSDGEYTIPPLLWLPALENVFKHTRNAESPDIEFRLEIKDNKFYLWCRNKLYPNAITKDESGGFGIVNLRKRLDLLFPEKHQLFAEPSGDYFIFELEVSLL